MLSEQWPDLGRPDVREVLLWCLDETARLPTARGLATSAIESVDVCVRGVMLPFSSDNPAKRADRRNTEGVRLGCEG